MVAGCVVDIAPLGAELDLHLRLESEVAEYQNAVLPDGAEDLRNQTIVLQQGVGIDTDDFSTDCLRQSMHGDGCAPGHGNGSRMR